MTNTRIIGMLLLGTGIVLVIIGANESHSVADKVSNIFWGHWTQATMWYVFGGIATGIVGLLMTMGVVGRTRS
jgi:hypothetical protein